jgi:hypothetical protein
MIKFALTLMRKKVMAKNPLTILMSLALILSFKGCSPLSKKNLQCDKTNWNTIGRQTAFKGSLQKWPPRRFASCLIGRPLEQTWKKTFTLGYKKGLNAFCTKKGGLRFGLKGRLYKKNCPSSQAPSFLKEYKKGLKVYHYKKEISNLQKKILSIKTAIKKAELSQKIQKEKFSKMEGLYLQKREITQFLKNFLIAKKITL